jgi:hypothetical protein
MAEASRIYDDPKHPQYGPVRRLYVMLLQLWADIGIERMETVYRDQYRTYWDIDLAFLMGTLEMSEPDAQRTLMGRCIRTLR